MISITTNKLVCNADLNLDGQEFEASGSEQQRDPAHDAAVSTSTRGGPHNDVELGSAQRHSAHQHVANAAAIHGEGWFPRARRTSRARRTPRTLLAHACASERWGPPWRARHALGAWHERGDPDESRRSNAPTPWGPPPLVAPSRLSHESMIHSNVWTLWDFLLDHNRIPGTKWSRGILKLRIIGTNILSEKPSSDRMLVRMETVYETKKRNSWQK